MTAANLSAFRHAGIQAQLPSEMDGDSTKRALKDELKRMLVEVLMLQVSAAEISDEQSLFDGPDGLGLDSVDALQIVVALDKRYQVKISDTEVAKQVLRSVATLADAIACSRGNLPAHARETSQG